MNEKPDKKQVTKKRRYRPGSRKGIGNPNPVPPPVHGQIKKGEVRNPGGRPKLLSSAYREWLAEEDADGITNAKKVAEKLGNKILEGDTPTAREFRQSTEGDKVRTPEDDIIDYLRDGKLTPAQVRDALPDDAEKLIAAAGLSGPTDSQSGEAQAPGRTDAGAGRGE